MITRRLALFRIASTSAVAATAATAIAATSSKVDDSRRPFEHPSEYLAAMQAIGWRPVALFQRLEDGSPHRMGVAEYGGSEDWILKTWDKFHAISMRAPVQLPMDVHPGGWWGLVWQYLYDMGLREDVTPTPACKKQREGDEA